MENDSVIIKSSDSGEQVEFSERNGLFNTNGSEYYRVTLKNNYLTASTRIYAFHPFGKLCWQYFEELSSYRRGWNGKKEWDSLESDFSISAESDTVGHITLEFNLNSSDSWSARININLDAGQLDDISKKVKQFFTVS